LEIAHPIQPTKDETKFPDLSPNLHHVPPLNEDVIEDSNPQGEKDKTSHLTQTYHRHQDCHLNANSKDRTSEQCAQLLTNVTDTEERKK
jgi:hypothetical protein